jgi:hypothetical protein
MASCAAAAGLPERCARGQERQICGRRAMPVVPPLATKLLSCGKRTFPVGNSGAYDHRSRCANASPASSADLTRQDIIQRTDGIPLFVEEMTKAVLEAEGEGAVENAVATIPSPSIGVPASLHASWMARLDRLGPAKEVAQIGAAVGREFSHALLQAVVRKPVAELQSSLDRLVTQKIRP